tara:strand:+ start:1650 stop:2342 length:693 start_codon:yes stop_codon:yes gene_type:complete
MKYYAIYKGFKTGIFTSWDICKSYINRFKGAKYKSFKTLPEAEYFVKYGKSKPLQTLDQFIIKTNPSPIKKIKHVKPVKPDIIVYTDGSCYNNGKRNAKAGIGIYFGPNDRRNISERITGKQTNNTAELKAIIKTIQLLETEIKEGKNIMIYSDSKYSIRCCTTYGEKLYKLNWKKNKPIPNLELVKKVFLLCKKYKNIYFTYIAAHTNKQDIHSIGNENADRLANLALL